MTRTCQWLDEDTRGLCGAACEHDFCEPHRAALLRAQTRTDDAGTALLTERRALEMANTAISLLRWQVNGEAPGRCVNVPSLLDDDPAFPIAAKMLRDRGFDVSTLAAEDVVVFGHTTRINARLCVSWPGRREDFPGEIAKPLSDINAKFDEGSTSTTGIAAVIGLWPNDDVIAERKRCVYCDELAHHITAVTAERDEIKKRWMQAQCDEQAASAENHSLRRQLANAIAGRDGKWRKVTP